MDFHFHQMHELNILGQGYIRMGFLFHVVLSLDNAMSQPLGGRIKYGRCATCL